VELKLSSIRLFRYELALRKPLPGRAGVVRRREGVLVALEAEGHVGWGDAAPIPGVSAEGIEQAAGELLEAAALLKGSRCLAGEEVVFENADLSSFCTSVRFALETAALGAAAHLEAKDLAGFIWEEPRGELIVNALVGGDAKNCVAEARAAVEAGFSCLKLKVGGDPQLAARTIGEVRRAVGPLIGLRLDANRVWPLEEACRFACLVSEYRIEYLEEPARDWEGVLNLVEQGRFPLSVALDETLSEFTVESLYTLPTDVTLVLKPTVLGFTRALQFAKKAEALGITVVVSACFESSVGLSALAALASGCNSKREVPMGLATGLYLSDDVTSMPLLPRRGRLEVRDCEVELERLRPFDHE